MKTMNYLFTVVCALLIGACTNETHTEELSSVDFKGSKSQEKEEEQEESAMYYLELEFHQQALKNEYEKLRYDLLVIKEELENGNDENQSQLEGIQIRLAEIEESLAFNEGGLDFWGGIPGGGLPPTCVPNPEEFRPCPMPRAALDNLVLFSEEWEELWEKGLASIHINDEEGNLVGKMIEMQTVEDTDGRFTRAIFEYDEESSFEAVVTKPNTRGEPRSSKYLLE